MNFAHNPTLSLPQCSYAPWFFKFAESGQPWYSKKCDSAIPTLCSDLYHSQEQSPGYPHGDGDCLAPGCDCGKVPCGFYVFNHSSTVIINGQSFQDWFINSYVLNTVGSSPLVSGFFWDDVWNPQCNIHDQVPHTCEDMGLTPADLIQLTADYQANMAALLNATLAAGKFAWQMMWTGGPMDEIGNTGLSPIVTQSQCAASLRSLCSPDAPPQQRAMAYGLSGGNPSVRNPQFFQDLVNFLLIRGPYAWLGWGWKGCSVNYAFPEELNGDYGTPSGLCSESSPGVFTRDFDKSIVTMDCNKYIGNITMK